MLAEAIHSVADSGNQVLLLVGGKRATRAPSWSPNKVRGRQSWSKFIRSAKAPELPVILLEDLAALLGLVIRTAEPMVTALYLEPDIYNPDHVPAARPERHAAPSH